MRDFEQLPHTADIKIRVYGTTKKDLFRNALIGMFQSIHPIIPGATYQNGRVVCKELPSEHVVEVLSPDQEALLVDFLSEALYLSDVNNEAYLDVTIDNLDEKNIKAVLHGVPVERFDVVEIKAVTYHDLHMKQLDDGTWSVDIVFDI